MNSICGCYYYVETDHHMRTARQYLPLLSSEAYSNILSTASNTVLKQTFKNPSTSDAIKSCVYTFPLYDGVSVVRFTCRIGSKTLYGRVKEKSQAKQIFDDAVAAGETAGLLEQSSDASDVFSTKLGNIPAGESVVVEITYVGELKHHDTDGIRFTIPTCIAPRYGNTSVSVYPMEVSPQTSESKIKITVDVTMPEGSFIKGVQSPSHPIAVSMGTVSTAADADPVMTKASATLALGQASLEKDFVLVVLAKDLGTPRAVLETHSTIPDHRALMLTLVPKFSLPPSRPEIVFVADRSGSMAGNIPMLVSAMEVFLKSMPVGVKFNICSFGSSFSFLWPKSQSYTKENLNIATAHLKSFDADMGGTETLSAIRATIERRYSDLPLEIMLLTDGDIWQQEQCFHYVNEEVAKSGDKIRVFPLGIGNGVSHALIEGIARAGNGFAQSVQESERLDNSVVRMLRGALSPHVKDYTLEVKYGESDDEFVMIEKVTDGMKVLLSEVDSLQEPAQKKTKISLFDPTVDPEKYDVKDLDTSRFPACPSIPPPKLLQAPHKIPSLFPFSRSVVYILMSPETIQRNPTSVVLRATSPAGPLELEIPVDVLPFPADTIHQLAARKAVQDLEEGRGWIYDAKDEAGTLIKERFASHFEDLVQKEAVRLGEKFQVAGKWCSFVAVAANESGGAKREDGNPNANESLELDVVEDGHFATRERNELSTSFMDGRVQPYYGLPAQRYRGGGPRSFVSRPVAHMVNAAQMGGSISLQKSSSMTRSLKSALPSFTQMFTPQQHLQHQPNGSPTDRNWMYGIIEQQGSQKSRRELSSPSGRPSVPESTSSPIGYGSSIALASRRSPSAQSFSAAPAAPLACTPMLLGAPPQGGMGLGAPPAFGSSYVAGGGCLVPAEEEINWGDKSATEKVLALISRQDFEGWWGEGDEEVAAILGLQVPQNPTSHGSQRSWVTVVVVSFLEECMSAEEGTWGLVVEKARGWLAEAVGAGALAGMELEARKLVKN